MFFMMGITDGRKTLNFTQTVICAKCGAYGRYQVFVTFTQLLLFFIPCFRWNRHYYVQMSCCGTLYELNPEKGRQIERGKPVTIEPQDLKEVQVGRRGRQIRRCPNCGYTTDENFAYCPKCGQKMQ